jgi:hypothetical protein
VVRLEDVARVGEEQLTQRWLQQRVARNCAPVFYSFFHTLNRQGDLIYYMYVVIDLPGITACDAEVESCNGLTAGSQFPAFGNPCAPCATNDAKAYDEYLDDGYTEAGTAEKTHMMRRAKDRWIRDKYREADILEASGAVRKDARAGGPRSPANVVESACWKGEGEVDVRAAQGRARAGLARGPGR